MVKIKFQDEMLKNKKRIVIKIGSSLLISSGKPRLKWLKSLTKDIHQLRNDGKEIIVVSSGAIALGKEKLKTEKPKLTLPEKQAAAAIGQIALMLHYQNYFAKLNSNVAQILITGEDATNRSRYLNIKNTINTLLKNNIIPIVNENDTIAVEEIKIGDNDRLAARIAQISNADILILLSDIEGLYNCNPKNNKNAQFISLVEMIDDKIEAMAENTNSSVGTGGMITKIKAAKMAFNSGCDCIIASGLKNHPISKIISGKKFTLFKAERKRINAKKQWIADGFNTKGELVINKAASEALFKNASLLPIGVLKVIGEFKKGEIVLVKNEQGKHLASGISRYSSTTAQLMIGKNQQDEIIHRNDLVIVAF